MRVIGPRSAIVRQIRLNEHARLSEKRIVLRYLDVVYRPMEIVVNLVLQPAQRRR